MTLTYFKRYRMELDLVGRTLDEPEVPPGYRLLAWDPALLEAHARAKYLSFRNEIDANVFACLGEWAGCHRLMTDIASKSGFLPEATWLAVRNRTNGQPSDYCGTIQGIRSQHNCGSVQNLGIVAEHRNRGLGTCLLYRAMEGFRRAGLDRVTLEVTAENQGAVRLYQRHGFVTVKTVFKAADVAYS